MIAKEKTTNKPWIDLDDAPELKADVAARARISRNGTIVREATGTFTKRGRPPAGDAAKEQVTLRLAPNVIRYFREGGAGWQTRLNAVLERHVAGTMRVRGQPMPRGVVGVFARAANEKTSKKAGTAPSKVLRSGRTGTTSKAAAGSALSQRPDRKKK